MDSSPSLSRTCPGTSSIDPPRVVADTVGEALLDREEQSPAATNPAKGRKRHLDVVTQSDSVRVKRVKYAEKSGVADKEAGQLANSIPTEHPSALLLDQSEAVKPKPSQLAQAERPRSQQAGSENGRDGDGNRGDHINSRHQPKRVPLTRKNLALFDKLAKKGKKASVSAPTEVTSESSTETSEDLALVQPCQPTPDLSAESAACRLRNLLVMTMLLVVAERSGKRRR